MIGAVPYYLQFLPHLDGTSVMKGTIQEARYKTVNFLWNFHRDKTVELSVEIPSSVRPWYRLGFVWEASLVTSVRVGIERRGLGLVSRVED